MRQVVERSAAVPPQGLKPLIGFATSLLAVWCQILLLATISLSPLAIGADPLRNVAICQTDDGTQPAQQKPGHPAHDCALCVLCLSHASQVALVSPTPTLPEQQSVGIVRLDAAYPRAQPINLIVAAQPRGPPSLI